MELDKIVGTYTIQDQYLELFSDNQKTIENDCPQFINDIRCIAKDYFKKNGVPNIKHEDYKYTDIESKLRLDYKNTFLHSDIDVNLNEVFNCDVPNLETHLILTINGWYYDKNISLKGIPKSVIIGSFKEIAKSHPDLVKKYFSKIANQEKDPFVAFNNMFSQDGLFIYVPKGVVIEKPIQVINILLSNKNQLSFQRNLIIADENAQVKIVSCDHTLSSVNFFTSQLTEIFAEKNSVIDYYNIQNEHNGTTSVNSTFFHQEESSQIISNIITLHGGLIRNNLFVKLDGEGCEHNMFGIFLIDKNQQVDNFTSIDHAKPNCYSNEHFKGVLDDFAQGVFRGKILVRKDSQKTNAFQSNNNILLTNDAKMQTKPQLEIYADDVKCSHGATIGQLDEEALFYMRTRGIDEKNARLLLMYAFSHEIIDKIRIEPLKERINELVEKRFRGELSKCNNCTYNCKDGQ